MVLRDECGGAGAVLEESHFAEQRARFGHGSDDGAVLFDPDASFEQEVQRLIIVALRSDNVPRFAVQHGDGRQQFFDQRRIDFPKKRDLADRAWH